MEHKTGDVVYLKSGGPSMTVSSGPSNGFCECHWFLKGELKRGEFCSDELTNKEPDSNKTTVIWS